MQLLTKRLIEFFFIIEVKVRLKNYRACTWTWDLWLAIPMLLPLSYSGQDGHNLFFIKHQAVELHLIPAYNAGWKIHGIQIFIFIAIEVRWKKKLPCLICFFMLKIYWILCPGSGTFSHRPPFRVQPCRDETDSVSILCNFSV